MLTVFAVSRPKANNYFLFPVFSNPYASNRSARSRSVVSIVPLKGIAANG
jgi:hypothetical protein